MTNDLKVRSEALLKNYPGSDLDLTRVKAYIPGLYAKYQDAISAISAAVVVGDSGLYKDAERNYIEVFNSFSTSGMNLRENERKQAEEKRGQIRDRIMMLGLDIATTESCIKTFETNLERDRNRLKDQREELKKQQEMLKALEGRA